MPTNDHLWDEHEAARYLQVSHHAIRKWKGEGKFAYIKIGSSVRYDPQEIRDFAERNRVPAKCQDCGKPSYREPLCDPLDAPQDFPPYASELGVNHGS